MLEIRPCCEHCATPLDPEHDDARICSYECTFCSRCATWELLGICPNCAGELVTRPRRPAAKLARDPPSTTVIHRPVDLDAHRAGVERRLAEGSLPTQVWTVAFCSRRSSADAEGYAEMAAEMDALAAAQPGYLGLDSVRSDAEPSLGISVSRWSSLAAMVSWRRVRAHEHAQQTGRDRWYDWYRSDVARVDRSSEFSTRTG